MRRWTNVRDAFVKSCKKHRETKTSGAGTTKIKKYVYNDQLKFLAKLNYVRQTEDSLTENPSEETDEYATNPEIPRAGTEEGATNPEIPTEANFETPRTGLGSRRRRKPDELELKMLKALEGSKPNRHLSFFNSIIPSLETFEDDDIVHFQIGVLQLISNTKQRKRMRMSSQPSTFSHAQESQEMTINTAVPSFMQFPTTSQFYEHYGRQMTSSTPRSYRPSENLSPALSTASTVSSNTTGTIESIDFTIY